MEDAASALSAMIDRYDPALAACGRSAVERLGARVPTATRLVYDNYNALVVGFGPDERASSAILSLAFYPRWVTLFFLNGTGLDDPGGILKGQGVRVRHVVLRSAADLDSPAIRRLIDQALERAAVPLPVEGRGPLVIKSVSSRQRARRPRA